LRVLQPILRMAVEDGLIRTNPAANVKVKVARSTTALFLTAGQVVALAEAMPTPQNRTWVYFAAYTGMRSGEIAALRIKHVDPLHRRVTVAEAISDVNVRLVTGRPKNGKVRTVAMPAFLTALVVEQMDGRAPDAYLFTDSAGGPMRMGNWRYRVFLPAVKRSLPPELHRLRIHDLRHTAASILANAGVPIHEVSRHLGHSGIAITAETYLHLFPETHDRIANALEGVWHDAANLEVAELPTR
jgi:integrase